MEEKMIRKYAYMIARVGLNIQKGQKVLVESCIEGYEFANIFMEEAYKLGASDVVINYINQKGLKIKSQYRPLSEVSTIKDYEYDMYQRNLDDGACTLRIEGVDPKLMEDASESQANAIFSYIDNIRNIMRKASREKHCRWCIVEVPTYAWATLLFPELEKEEALDRLWDTLLKLCYIDETNDIVKVWEEKNKKNAELAKKLDSYHLRKLHYTSSNGTDLIVELTENSKYYHERNNDELAFNPNIPTEEICTSPYKYGTNGIVYSTRPLLLGGKSIENFGFRFKDGKVVEVLANKGKEMLESLIHTDDNACYLGETALVEYSSPISKSGLVYYTTLIDENASCHLALGRALSVGKDFNDSSIHIDFMIGTKDMSIVGTTKDNEEIQIFKNGDFAI